MLSIGKIGGGTGKNAGVQLGAKERVHNRLAWRRESKEHIPEVVATTPNLSEVPSCQPLSSPVLTDSSTCQLSSTAIKQLLC